MVDAMWHVLIYAVSALVLFAEADWRLMIPLLMLDRRPTAAALRYFVPRVKARSWISSEARSKLMGRIVDGYTNIATLKLFAHTNLGAAVRARGDQRADRQDPARRPRDHRNGLP